MCSCEGKEYEKILELAKQLSAKEGKTMVVYKKSCGAVDFSRKEEFKPEGKSAITLVLP